MLLATGANAVDTATKTAWTLEAEKPNAIGSIAAGDLLPVYEKGQPTEAIVLFQTHQAGSMDWSGGSGEIRCNLSRVITRSELISS